MRPFDDIKITRGEGLLVRQKLASRAVIGLFLLAFGVFLLLCDLAPSRVFSFKRAAVPALLITLGGMFFLLGFVQKNATALWLSAPLFVAAGVSLAAGYTSAGYSRLYGFYVLAPAIASAVTACYTKEWKSHIKVIIPSFMFGLLFVIGGLAGWSWKAAVAAFVLLLGAMFLVVPIGKE